MRDGGWTSRWFGRWLPGFGACVAAMQAAAAQPAQREPQEAPRDLRVVVKTVAEQPLTGRLSSLSLTGGAELVVDGARRLIAPEDLVRITTPEVSWARAVQDATLRLADGGLVHGRIVGGDQAAIVVETRDFGRVPIPLDVIDAVLTPAAYQDAYRSARDWLERRPQDAQGQDRLLLTNGDVLRGFVTGVTADSVRLERSLGEALLAHRVIVAIRFADLPGPKPSSRRVVASVRSSGRFVATDCRWSGERIEFQSAMGPTIEIEAERLVSLDFYGGRWEWLSDHQPISFEHTPMLGLDWAYTLDRNVLGEPMRVRGEVFRHGIGVHGRTRVTFDLKGRYRKLVTQFGIDDQSGALADVDVAILIDGKRSFDQRGVRRGRLHGPVRLDVARAKRVELVTDFGANGDLQDRFNWVAPALIR